MGISGSSPKGKRKQNLRGEERGDNQGRPVRPRLDTQQVQYATVQQPEESVLSAEEKEKVASVARILHELGQQQVPARAPIPQKLPIPQGIPHLARDFFRRRGHLSREELKKELHKQSEGALEGTLSCLETSLQSAQISDSFNEKKTLIELIEEVESEALPGKKSSKKVLGQHLFKWYINFYLNNKDFGSAEEEKNFTSIKNHVHTTLCKDKIDRNIPKLRKQLNKFDQHELRYLSYFIRSRDLFQRCVTKTEQMDLIREVLEEKKSPTRACEQIYLT